MAYTVRLDRSVGKFLKDLYRGNRKAHDAIVEELRALEVEPRHNGCRALQGGGLWAGQYRVRVGDYRVLFRIDDSAQLVVVFRVRHRKEAY